MDEPKSRVGWVLAGVGAALFALMMFYLFNPRWFGERFIHFDGSIRLLEPLGADRIFVVENVETGGGEDGPTTVGDRWRIVEAATGKNLVGPHYINPVRWASIEGDRLVAMLSDDLEVRDFDNKLIANLASWKGVGSLRHNPNDVSLGDDGRITALSDDGRYYLLDLNTLQATAIAQRPPGHGGTAQHFNTTGVKGIAFTGQPRSQLNGQGPDYLEPGWILDRSNNGPISAGAGGTLMIHYTRMHDSKQGRGPMLSAVNAQGAELWRYVLPFEHLHSVVVRGGQLVIGLDERNDMGPSWLRVLDLATGQEVWKMSL